ncbi:TPA: hypothetical protein ACH3X3_008948 [Trebouxia sp. C0006]
MRVAQYRVALPAVPCNSAYQEHEPYSIRAHPGWMNLFKHHHKGNDATDAKVARRSQSTVTRPQGVLDLMENSWFGPDAASSRSPETHLSVHDSANSFSGAGKHNFRKAYSQGAQATRSNHTRQIDGASSSGRHTGTVQAAQQDAVPTSTMHQQAARTTQRAATDAQDARLGTWANRQIRFPWPRKTAELFDSAGSHSGTAKTDVGSPAAISTPTNIPGSPSISSPLPPPSMQKPPPAPRRPSTDEQHKQPTVSRRSSLDRRSSFEEDESKVVEAAWRWRFGRRWVQEQAKQFDPEFGREEEQEEWDDALGYLDACGPGFNMIARTSSEFGNEARLPRTTSLLSQDSVSKSLNSLLLEDGSYSHRESALGDAAKQDGTQGVVAIAKKAQDLYKQQQEIQKKADQRWEGAAQRGTAWLGQALDPVRIEVQGKFTFVLVKVENRQGSSRLLVRGRQGCSQAALMQDVEKEMSEKIALKKLPTASISLLGSGVMQWSKDKQIDVMQGSIAVGMDGSVRSKADVAHVAGALIRSALPMHYHITVNGGRI